MAQKKKADSYYPSEFIKTLIDEEAEIRIFGNTYSSKKGYLSIRTLFNDMFNFDSNDKFYQVTRKSSLAKEHADDGTVTDIKRKVVHQLGFFFDNDAPIEPASVSRDNSKRLETEPFGDTIKAMRDKLKALHRRSNFYINGECRLADIYPNYKQKITESVTSFLSEENAENIYRQFFNSAHKAAPFHELTEKLYDGKFITNVAGDYYDIRIEPKAKPENLDKLIEKYTSCISDMRKPYEYWVSTEIIRRYRLEQRSKYKKQNIKDKVAKIITEEFDQSDTFFDRFRYQQLYSIKSKLLKMSAEDWPTWTVNHLILVQYEYICLRNCLENIVFEELINNIHFSLFTSTDGKTINLQTDIDNFHELGEVLIHYSFPGGIEEHVKIKRDNILDGQIYKNPESLVARNQQDSLTYIFSIGRALNELLCKTICEKIGFDKKVKDDMVNKVDTEFCEHIADNLKN